MAAGYYREQNVQKNRQVKMEKRKLTVDKLRNMCFTHINTDVGLLFSLPTIYVTAMIAVEV